MIQASDLSEFERCALIPSLKRKWEPEHWPVREKVKQYFSEYIFGDSEQAADNFLIEAAGRGFEYGAHDHYELAKDYASWIDGALQILNEDMDSNCTPIPSVEVAGEEFSVVGYKWDDTYHVVRVVSTLGDRNPRWPELILLAAEKSVWIHQFRLPAIVKGRLASPLSMAYRHPMTGGYRLARHEGEGKFGPNWKRVGRWEIPEFPWGEWRQGIDRDRCMPLIQESYDLDPLTVAERRRISGDIEHIIASMGKNTHPRKWEACENCIFRGICHGDKQGYIRKGVQRATVQRQDETEGVVS